MHNPIAPKESKENKMHNPFALKEEGIFSNRKIFSMWLPVLIEQAMVAAISIADTSMVAHVGESAVAGISLIATVDNLVKKILLAFAVGGSVITSQYIGSKKLDKANSSAKTILYGISTFSIITSLGMFIFNNQIIGWIAGNSEQDVILSAKTYLTIMILTFPFFAIYYVASATFRAMGNTRISMYASLLMMMINLSLKWVMIYKLEMGVFGAGISTLLAVIFIGTIMLGALTRKKSTIRIKKIYKPEIDWSLMTKVINIGLPNGIENGMFQFGILILQRLIASFGTVALAANAIAKALTPISFTTSSSFGLILMTIVGQCMGARNIKHAKMYTWHIIKINYLIVAVVNITCIIFASRLVGIYNLSDEAISLAKEIFVIYMGMGMIFYPIGFVLPQALRGAGDTKFTMVVSFSTMFAVRVGFAYILGKYMGLGIVGVWIAMTIEWVIKGGIYIARYLNGKWQTIRVI